MRVEVVAKAARLLHRHHPKTRKESIIHRRGAVINATALRKQRLDHIAYPGAKHRRYIVHTKVVVAAIEEFGVDGLAYDGYQVARLGNGYIRLLDRRGILVLLGGEGLIVNIYWC